jgi:hypothetical protein
VNLATFIRTFADLGTGQGDEDQLTSFDLVIGKVLNNFQGLNKNAHDKLRGMKGWW